ncbi:MAG: acyltransferase [Acidobacteriota bacterium]|nr:acyltransferase [Acidobacteriota bacterium]
MSARHVTALDGIRGIAVLMVILWHASEYVQGTGLLEKLVRLPLRIGWSGVDLFFVLSGFLITGILLDTRQSPNYFRSFYARRALRIFPLYYLVLTTILVAAHFLPKLDKSVPIPHDRIFYFFYLNNWWPLLRDTWHGNLIGHFWSLAVEEQFYLLWSLCVFIVRPKHILKVALGGIAGAFLIRWGLYAHSGLTRDLVENTFARMDSLLVGAFLAGLVRRPNLLKRLEPYVYRVGIVSALGIMILIYVIKDHGASQVFGFSLLAFAYGAAVLFAYIKSGDSSTTQRLLCSKQLTTLGKYSYGMYVYHVPILFAVGLVIGRFIYFRGSLGLTLLFIGLVFVLTFVTAKLSFDLFESQFLRLKKYFRAG